MITTDRTELVGAHITPEEKELLRKVSRNEGGMSKFIHRLIRAELQRRGYDLKPEAA